MSISCLRCNYPITEPLCASCTIDEINVWLSERSLKQEIIRTIHNELKGLLKNIELLNYTLSPSRQRWKASAMKCIRCKKEMHLMCFYCVSKEATQIVNSHLSNKTFLRDFHESFNTELYDHGLIKEEPSFYLRKS